MKCRFIETTDDAWLEPCAALLTQLRTHLTAPVIAERVRAQMAAGYRLACVIEDGAVVAVAGFRILENLAWRRFLYVDDLVTDAHLRSRGHGRALFHELVEYARVHRCDELHLDSGVQRHEAHRFYFGRGLRIASHHFSMALGGN